MEPPPHRCPACFVRVLILAGQSKAHEMLIMQPSGSTE